MSNHGGTPWNKALKHFGEEHRGWHSCLPEHEYKQEIPDQHQHGQHLWVSQLARCRVLCWAIVARWRPPAGPPASAGRPCPASPREVIPCTPGAGLAEQPPALRWFAPLLASLPLLSSHSHPHPPLQQPRAASADLFAPPATSPLSSSILFASLTLPPSPPLPSFLLPRLVLRFSALLAAFWGVSLRRPLRRARIVLSGNSARVPCRLALHSTSECSVSARYPCG